MSHRLSYKPIANLFAAILIIGFNFLDPGGPEITLLAIFMVYVAASSYLPRPANARREGRRLKLFAKH